MKRERGKKFGECCLLLVALTCPTSVLFIGGGAVDSYGGSMDIIY